MCEVHTVNIYITDVYGCVIYWKNVNFSVNIATGQ